MADRNRATMLAWSACAQSCPVAPSFPAGSGAGRRPPGELGHQERDAPAQRRDQLDQLGRGVGDVTADERRGVAVGERAEPELGRAVPVDEASPGRLQRARRRNRAVREHDAHPLAARRPGEVVQQAQAAVVGVVHVVDGEQQALTRRGQADQFGRGEEEPLVGAPSGPRDRRPVPHPLDLVPVRAGQAGQQPRDLPAPALRALDDRGVGQAPSTGAADPWPARYSRSVARAAMAASSDDLPAPASPLMISVRFPPAAASSSARSAMEISRSRPISGPSRRGNTSCAASRRSRRAEASGPGATPSSCRSARSRRSNWRSAACRSPLAACSRMRARWAHSSPGSSSASRLPAAVQAQQVQVTAAGAGRGAARPTPRTCPRGSSSPPYSASASLAAAASPSASARRASSSNRTASTRHAAAGTQDHLVAAQHHRVRHAEGAPGEVRRLVQLRAPPRRSCPAAKPGR